MSPIHAIELYLNALLLHKGHAPAEIRGYQHDLAKRAGLAAAKALRLRQRTLHHLGSLSAGREYRATRCGHELGGNWNQLNRLTATLAEVRAKVGAAIYPAPRELGHGAGRDRVCQYVESPVGAGNGKNN